MFPVYLSLGSNLGDRDFFLNQARLHIAGLPQTEVLRCSSIYETEPWGGLNQNPFLNQIIEIKTGLGVEDLLNHCNAIEFSFGRKREKRWGPRTVDIDIVLYGSEGIDSENLRVPHPQMHNRRFVLVPLAELAADLYIDAFDKNVQTLLDLCRDTGYVRHFKRGDLWILKNNHQ
jgi:2-amino-4-hydroxy-6-hydroxymethyldihydropteridine diphosphokinase